MGRASETGPGFFWGRLEDVGAIQPVHPKLFEAVASELFITHHETGERFRWEVNSAQMKWAREAAKHPWVYALKPRQVGISTSTILDDVLFTVLNERAGHKIETWLVWDKEENGAVKLDLCWDFCTQLGFEGKKTELDIVFPGGSAIRVLTPGGSRVGASRTCHRIHASELPNWPDPEGSYNSLKQSLIRSGRFLIETTMLVGSELPKNLWENACNDVRRGANDFWQVFFPVEEHHEYKADPEGRDDYGTVLDPGIREWLVEEGFTDDRTMTWMQWALYNNIANADRVALLREYPQTPKHCFNLAKGRWLRCEPLVVPHEAVLLGNDLVKIYKRPEETSGHLVGGIDTAGGTGKDSNAIALLDHKTRELVASYVDAHSTIDEMMAVALWLQETYTINPRWTFGRARPMPRKPLFIIEKNTIGQATKQAAERVGLNHELLHTTDGTRYDGLQFVRQYVEDGTIFGPKELSEEADSLHVEDGKFKGRKDFCMALGMSLRHIAENPLTDPVAEAQERAVRFKGGTPRKKTWAKTL